MVQHRSRVHISIRSYALVVHNTDACADVLAALYAVTGLMTRAVEALFVWVEVSSDPSQVDAAYRAVHVTPDIPTDRSGILYARDLRTARVPAVREREKGERLGGGAACAEAGCGVSLVWGLGPVGMETLRWPSQPRAVSPTKPACRRM